MIIKKKIEIDLMAERKRVLKTKYVKRVEKELLAFLDFMDAGKIKEACKLFWSWDRKKCPWLGDGVLASCREFLEMDIQNLMTEFLWDWQRNDETYEYNGEPIFPKREKQECYPKKKPKARGTVLRSAQKRRKRSRKRG